MFIEERHQKILDIIKECGSISNVDIQRKFNIGYDSAKRDLRILEEKGLLKRTHGGAISARKTSAGKPIGTTLKDFTEIKPNYLAVSKKAVSMIEDGDVIFISPVTLGYFMVQNIPDKIKNLKIVTNSIILAEEIRKKENVSVILLGGEMDKKGNCYDAFAIEMIKNLRFDKAFISAAAISADFGISIQKSQYINFYESVLNSSKKIIGMFPTEKVGFESIVKICPASDLDIMITDANASEEDLDAFEEKGIEIIIADHEK